MPLDLLDRVFDGAFIYVPGSCGLVFHPFVIIFSADQDAVIVFNLENEYPIPIYDYDIKLGRLAFIFDTDIR